MKYIDPMSNDQEKAYLRACNANDVVEAQRLAALPAVNPGCVSFSGGSATFYAAQGGAIDALRWLLTDGAAAKLSAVDFGGATPFIEAARNGHVEAMAFLHGAGADLHTRDTENGWSALTAAAVGGHAAAVQRLLALGLDPAAVDATGKTALDWATLAEKSDVVALLAQ